MKTWGIGTGTGLLAIAAGLALSSCETPSTATPSTDPASAPPKVIPKDEIEMDRVLDPFPRERPVLPEPPVEPPPAAKPKGEITQMDLGTLFQLREDGRVFLVDVRPGFFYNLRHIPGAISMPKKTFEADFAGKQAQFDAAVSANKPIVLYCADHNCPDARNAARILAKRGYSSSVYKGGWKEWNESGVGG